MNILSVCEYLKQKLGVNVNGDYYNVVGLPVARLKREIMEFIENQ